MLHQPDFEIRVWKTSDASLEVIFLLFFCVTGVLKEGALLLVFDPHRVGSEGGARSVHLGA